MTCIVAIKKDGAVYMGADSAAVGGLSLTVRADPKIYKNGDYIFGFTSSFRMGQLLGHAFVPPFPYKHLGLTIEKFMSTVFVDAVRKCLKDGGYARKDNETESGGLFLVGFEGRIFRIDSDYQVGESSHDFESVGCGSDIALGALWALHEDVPPSARIRVALAAAEQFSAGVRGPFLVCDSRVIEVAKH